MANKTEKKNTAKNANAKENFNPKTFMEVIAGHINPNPSNGERVVKLAKERDFLCDRIAEAEAEYKECTCAADKKTIAEQLEAMRNYKFHLNIRIKSALDE